MSVTIRTCLVITCTRCGEVNDECQDVHADTIDQVRDLFTDWQWSTPDTPELCPDCVAHLDCERDGHQWDDWHLLTALRRRYRCCQHCRAIDGQEAA
ncbi:hypothetical protein GCM10022224_036620 [Nonomuraea antimicrobica]|uniref:Cysteine-rich CWC n=1 Tax=Nonomuraea antimicrobica TaxID=561173 RepID=A0ABP7BW69_9ACTN